MGEAAGPVSISLFGHVSISSTRGRGASIALPKAAIALLTYVIVFRSETLRRDRIAYALWPDEPEVEARANLRRHLYLLGRALSGTGEPCLIVDARTVRWNAECEVVIDAIAFADRIDVPATRAEALAYYKGDLALDVDAEWLDAPRADLRSRFCTAAHDEARAALVAGDTARANALAERILALDPWREDAVRIVMESRAAAGDRAGALGYYHDFCARLRAEVDAVPMAQTRELAERLTRASEGPRTPIGAPLSRLIGRSREIATIEELLENARLVTITGPGGVGKTRLAAEIVARFAREKDPIVASLASVEDDRRSVERAVLEALAIVASEGDAIDVIARIVGSRKMLLSLDNADRVTQATADFARDLLRRTASLRILVTSQQRLRLEGERVFALSPLSVPGAAADFAEIERSEAVQLFFDRAKAIDASFALTPQVAPAIASICRHVDGMPLPLELAAGRSNVLAIPEIEARLSDRFDFLRSRTVGEREQHRTLRATLDWSFELLNARECAAFRAFAVFANGWTLAAATALVGDTVIDDLSDLIEKSLVVTHTAGPSRRYGYLESIRLYARERLNSAGERMELERRAFLYFADFVATRARRFSSRDEKAAFDEIAADHENIIAALDAAIARGEVAESASLAIDLTHYWVVRGFAAQGQDRLSVLLEHEGSLPANIRVDLRNAASRVYLLRGEIESAAQIAKEAISLASADDYEIGEADALYAFAKCEFSKQSFARSESDLDRSLAIYTRRCNRLGEARVLDLLGQFAEARGTAPQAAAFFRRSLSIYETLGDLMGTAVVNYHLGFSALISGDYTQAVALNTKALNAWHENGFLQGEYLAKHNLASAELSMGHSVSAARLYLDCVRNAHRYGFRRELCNGLDRLADLLASRDPELAVQCVAYAALGREESGYAVLPSERVAYDACMQRLRETFSTDDFSSQWNRGRVAEENELIASLGNAIDSEI
jgi:predicted ATPase/DNA-binding SARP family transcriptional activator